MTDKQLNRAKELKRQIKICNNILTLEKDKNVWFCNSEISFMRKELFDVVKSKKADLEREYSDL